MRKVKVIQPADKTKEVSMEILATAITEISDGIKKLRSGRLNDRALFLLIQHAIPGNYLSPRPTIKEIKLVIEAMKELENIYLK